MSFGERELIIGSGNRRQRKVSLLGSLDDDWKDPVTLDMDPNCGADIIHDLDNPRMPFFEDNEFAEIHAYEALEHCGRQGDWRFFFAQFSEFWRILKPDGLLLGSTPGPGSPWVWGDPGHVRHITPESFTFLMQPEYTKQVGVTAMSDYRHAYKADFEPRYIEIKAVPPTFFFVLRAVKPSRISI